MEFDKKRIEKLKDSLKKCYEFKYQSDKKRLGYLFSTMTSEKNPFIKALSVDLRNRFKELDEFGEEKQTGFSVYTLRDIFFNEEKVNYDGDTIANLELYCQEIVKEIAKKKSIASVDSPKERKRNKRKWWLIPLIFVLGILAIVYVVLSNMGNRAMDSIDEILGDTLVGGFDPDPANNGTGFFSINDTIGGNTANQKDTITIPKLNFGDKAPIVLHIDFRNSGLADIKNAKATLHFADTILGDNYSFTAQLSGEGVPSIYDTTTIVNLPESSVLKIIAGYIQNQHLTTDPEYCKGYEYTIEFNEEQLRTKEFSLDVLDSYENGWCDQGYVNLIVSIENITK